MPGSTSLRPKGKMFEAKTGGVWKMFFLFFYICSLVVEPIRLTEYVHPSNWIISPGIGMNIKKYLKFHHQGMVILSFRLFRFGGSRHELGGFLGVIVIVGHKTKSCTPLIRRIYKTHVKTLPTAGSCHLVQYLHPYPKILLIFRVFSYGIFIDPWPVSMMNAY